jgi:KDO2-lipid IV(A) lauroyltransferase
MMPRRLGLVLFSFLGMSFYYISYRERNRTLHHLRFIYGQEWSERKIKTVAVQVFKNSGKNLFDAVNLGTFNEEKLDKVVSTDSLDEFKQAYDKGKGVIGIVAHVGCFEMLLHFFSLKGMKSFAIGRKFKNAKVDEVVRAMRSGPDIEYMDRSENSRKVIRFLQQGRVMGALIDQDTKVEGVFADFLGKTAFTPSGPMHLAMKFNIPVFVVTTARMSGDKHHVFVSEQLSLDDTGNFEADLVSNVQKANDIISGAIRKNPEQWVWMHKRWATKPESVMQK